MLRRDHLGKAGIAGCFLSEEVKRSVRCFAEAFAFVPFSCSLFSCLYWTGLAVLCVTAKARFFSASWKHLNVYAVTGSVALWPDLEFGVTLDWLFLIKNEISSIWVLANHQNEGEPTWFYKPGSSQCVGFERNRLGQPDVVEILKGGMCEKEKGKKYKFKKYDEMMEANQKTCSLIKIPTLFQIATEKKLQEKFPLVEQKREPVERHLRG